MRKSPICFVLIAFNRFTVLSKSTPNNEGDRGDGESFSASERLFRRGQIAEFRTYLLPKCRPSGASPAEIAFAYATGGCPPASACRSARVVKELQEIKGLDVRVLEGRRIERRFADTRMTRQTSEQRIVNILEPHRPLAEHAALDLAFA